MTAFRRIAPVLVVLTAVALAVAGCGRKTSPRFPEGAAYPEKTYPTPEATYVDEE